ncbi:MAG: hypothetical protein ACRDNS_16210 [Trebonia sp.]
MTWQGNGPVRAVITVSDAEGYTLRDDDGQRDLQAWMNIIESQAAVNAGLDRQRAYLQGTGDGSHTTWPPDASEFDLITNYLRELRYELVRVNDTLSERGRIRMRLSVCAGLVEVGPQGVTGQSAIRAALLVNNDHLRGALRDSPDQSLAVIIEDKLFEEVVLTRRRGLRPEDYQRTVIRDKYGRDHVAWITVPGKRPTHPTSTNSHSTHAPQPHIQQGEPTMSDSISIAADALVAFLAAGGGAVAAGAAQEAGAELYKSTNSVAAKIIKRLHGRRIDSATVVTALRDALDDGEITMADVDRIGAERRASAGTGTFSVGEVHANVSIVGNNTKLGNLTFGESDG